MIYLDQYAYYLRVTDESFEEHYTTLVGAWWRYDDSKTNIQIYDRWDKLFWTIPVASVTNYSGDLTQFTNADDCTFFLSSILA